MRSQGTTTQQKLVFRQTWKYWLRSIRTILTLLVLVCLLPGVIGATIILYSSYQRERTQLESETIATARAMTQAIDGELGKALVAAQALATSPHLQPTEFAAFHLQATDLLLQSDVGDSVVVSDAEGQQLVNTLRRPSDRLPRHGNPEQLLRVFATRRPVISDVYLGGVTRRPLVSVDVPVLRNGKVSYDLSVGVFPERLGKIYHAVNLSPDWVVSIFDKQGGIAFRSHALEVYIGKKGAPALLRRMTEVSEGVVETNTLEGVSVSAVFSRSPTTGWTVAIGIPTQHFNAELQHRFLPVLVIAVFLIAAGIVLASVLAGRIAGSIRSLVAPALALGSGQRVVVPSTDLRETNEVSSAIANASHLLSLRTLATSIYHSIGDGVFATDCDGTIVSVNPSYCALTGYTAEELVGANPRILKSGRQEPDFYHEMWNSINRSGCWKGEIWNRRKDGTDFLATEEITVIHDENGQIQNYIGVIADITESKRNEEEMRHQAFHDALTNLPNRVLFMDRLHQEILYAHRNNTLIALLYIDLDKFKEINDSLGHDVGDELLKTVATRLTSCVRASDTVGRLGGDEFTAILRGLAGKDDAAQTSQKILEELCRPFIIGQHELNISASIGVALYPQDGDAPDNLMKAADDAMYKAKRGGRTAYVFASIE